MSGELLLRGFGVPVAKSVEFSLASMHPPLLRKSEVVLLGAGACADPSKQSAVPYPIKSITEAENGQPLSVIAVVLLTNATFAAVAERLAVPLASDAGRLAPTPPPDPSCTRK